MGLRLRRGTNAQRLLITPVEGELVYTTDTKRLWVGDGSTLGGIMVNSGSAYGLDDLTDVDLSLSPNTGDVLKWDGDKFIAAAEGAFTPGGNYFIDIIDENDDVILNATAGWFAGSIRSLDTATILVDADNKLFWGDLNGDVRGDLKGSVFADDSSVMVDAINGNFFGNLIGNVTGNTTGTHTGTVIGDLRGSVFNDDSTLIIDATAGKRPQLLCDVDNTTILTDLINAQATVTREIVINQRLLDDDAREPAVTIFSKSDGLFDGPYIQLVGFRNQPGVGQQPLQIGDTAGQIRFSSADIGNSENRAIPVVLNSVISEVGDNETTFTNGKFQVVLLNGPNPGDASFTEITKGGVLSTPVLKTGVYADATARDAYFTDRSISPAAGMIIFLTSTTKFQGFNGSAWTDLN